MKVVMSDEDGGDGGVGDDGDSSNNGNGISSCVVAMVVR